MCVRMYKYMNINRKLELKLIFEQSGLYGPCSKQCPFCLHDGGLMHDTYVDDMILKCCYLCHIVLNFGKMHIGKAILIHSELSQEEINGKVNRFFGKNKRMPLPLDIDAGAKLVKIPLYEYARKGNLEGEYKVFFTDRVIEGMKSYNMFSKDKVSVDLWSSDIFDKTPFCEMPKGGL